MLLFGMAVSGIAAAKTRPNIVRFPVSYSKYFIAQGNEMHLSGRQTIIKTRDDK